jgi:hypothetical protein
LRVIGMVASLLMCGIPTLWNSAARLTYEAAFSVSRLELRPSRVSWACRGPSALGRPKVVRVGRLSSFRAVPAAAAAYGGTRTGRIVSVRQMEVSAIIWLRFFVPKMVGYQKYTCH